MKSYTKESFLANIPAVYRNGERPDFVKWYESSKSIVTIDKSGECYDHFEDDHDDGDAWNQDLFEYHPGVIKEYLANVYTNDIGNLYTKKDSANASADSNRTSILHLTINHTTLEVITCKIEKV